MTAHKHADLMLQYAQDAMETDKPWERWEIETLDGWDKCGTSISWEECNNYRRKPQTIKVGKWEFPKPIEQPLGCADVYYYVDFNMETAEFIPFRDTWTNNERDDDRLAGNLCHLSYDAALAHADVLNAICRGMWNDPTSPPPARPELQGDGRNQKQPNRKG